jgi:alkylation response protein AidB-like acyl-CoA dehydrogenase
MSSAGPASMQELEELRRSVRGLFTRHWPVETARAFRYRPPGGLDTAPAGLWRALAHAGILGIPFPEPYGGGGASMAPLAVVLHEAGRALCPSLLAATLATARAIDGFGSEQQRAQWLPRLISGEMMAATVLTAGRAGHATAPIVRAHRRDHGWQLTGSLALVAGAAGADVLTVTVELLPPPGSGQSAALAIVPMAGDGVHVTPRSTMVGGELGDVLLDAVQITGNDLLGSSVEDPAPSHAAGSAVAHARAVLSVLRSLELLGGASAVLERTVAYASARRQFGRPIGSFQAVQHLVANASIAIDGAQLAAEHALLLVDRGGLAVREVAIAALTSGRASKQAMWTAHQVHGGIGFAAESDLHLWSERTKVLDVLSGGAGVHLADLAGALASSPLRPAKEDLSA